MCFLRSWTYATFVQPPLGLWEDMDSSNAAWPFEPGGLPNSLAMADEDGDGLGDNVDAGGGGGFKTA